jgi:hypothetical protein
MTLDEAYSKTILVWFDPAKFGIEPTNKELIEWINVRLDSRVLEAGVRNLLAEYREHHNESKSNG